MSAVFFGIKKAVGLIAAPLVAMLLVAIAAVVLGLRGGRRAAVALSSGALAVLYLSAFPPLADALIGPLERAYPAGQSGAFAQVGVIVVLGTSYDPQPGFPVTAALEQEGIVRLIEGVRLARETGAKRLVVSGGARPGLVPSARGYARLAIELGIDRASLVVLDQPLDTNAEAVAVGQLLGDEEFLLVTSAYHMPRAMRLMQRAGARAIPAPTGQSVRSGAVRRWTYLLPSTLAMRKSERAIHEYLGLAVLLTGIGA